MSVATMSRETKRAYLRLCPEKGQKNSGSKGLRYARTLNKYFITTALILPTFFFLLLKFYMIRSHILFLLEIRINCYSLYFFSGFSVFRAADRAVM